MLCCGADEDVHAHIAHRGKISIHGPRVGADAGETANLYNLLEFQSTTPVWGPT